MENSWVVNQWVGKLIIGKSLIKDHLRTVLIHSGQKYWGCRNKSFKMWNLRKLKKDIRTFLKIKCQEKFGNKDFQKFVVITSPRTGSNLLTSLLSSHREVYAFGENFNQIKENSCKEIWRHTFSKKMPYIKTVGFKIFYDHPLASEDREVWDFIKKDKDIKIIHLVRENIVRSHLSLLIAYKTNVWGLTPSMQDIPLQDRKVQVDVKSFIKNLREIASNKKEIRDSFKEHEFYEISYEILTANLQGEMNKLFDYLEVPRREVKSNLRKQNRENLDDLVKNYDEFRKKLEKTEFKFLLEE